MARDYSSEVFEDIGGDQVNVQDLYGMMDGKECSAVRLRCMQGHIEDQEFYGLNGEQRMAYYFEPSEAEKLGHAILKAAASAKQRNEAHGI